MKGLLLIPDISGFTNFVKKIDADLGVRIISDLLNVLIDSNPLPVELSEIEGDAILFYRVGTPVPAKKLFAGLQTMYEAFSAKYAELKDEYNINESLSLKFIVHYGEINVYDIKGFRKLYGKTVIESHSLLKNGHGKSNYVLITDDYLDASRESDMRAAISNWAFNIQTSQVFEGLRKIGYSFYDYFPTHSATLSFSAAA